MLPASLYPPYTLLMALHAPNILACIQVEVHTEGRRGGKYKIFSRARKPSETVASLAVSDLLSLVVLWWYLGVQVINSNSITWGAVQCIKTAPNLKNSQEMYKGNARWDVTVLTEIYEELSGDLRLLNTLKSFHVLKCISKSSSFTRQKEMSRKKNKNQRQLL